jgi:hypothetical protein
MVIKICSLLPENAELGRPHVETIEKALDQVGGVGGWAPWGAATAALAAYRAGDYPRAVRRSNKSPETEPKAPPGSTEYVQACPAMALGVRAMAEHRLQRKADALQSFARAAALIPPELRALTFADRKMKLPVVFDVLQHDWVFADHLRQEAERLLFPNLPVFLAGKYQPRDNDERLALAAGCHSRGLHRSAAGLYADAFTADPKAGEDGKAGHRFAAACCAVRAGSAVHLDPPGEQERARWLGQGLGWLRAELAALTQKQQTGTPEDRREVGRAVQRWLREPDLARVRDLGAIALLPPGDRAKWTRLWADVRALRATLPERPE